MLSHLCMSSIQFPTSQDHCEGKQAPKENRPFSFVLNFKDKKQKNKVIKLRKLRKCLTLVQTLALKENFQV